MRKLFAHKECRVISRHDSKHFPEATDASITIYDVTGHSLKHVKANYTNGYHEVVLKSDEFNYSGVLYYQLDTEKYTATRKMILLE